jgi:HPt (histidine-containing phosphotransfer) domain-containing protein
MQPEPRTNGKPVIEALADDWFNPQFGQSLMNGNQVIYQSLLRSFVTLYADLPAQIERLIRDNNRSGLVRLCHNLKSTTGQVGSAKLSAQSDALEKAIKTAPWPLDDSFRQQCQRYCLDIAQLQRQVETYLETHGLAADTTTADTAAANVAHPDAGDLEQAKAVELRQLQVHLGEHDPVTSRQALNQLLQMAWPESLAGKLRQIEKLLSQYQFEQALDLTIQLTRR